MGKRSDFKRVERDFYPTPLEGVLPLVPHLPNTFRFYEPCAGDGALVSHLERFGGHCLLKSDIEPLAGDIMKVDFFGLSNLDAPIITNPPWARNFLHPMIDNILINNWEAWLLFDADWMHTKQSAEYMKYCSHIVSIGRLKWIPDSKMTGKDNCCWYRFSSIRSDTQFVGR